MPRRPRIDLHTHSTASDGTDRPAELVAVAAAAGVDVLAITDHDTTAGWAEAAAALRPGMRLLRGAEFSCVSPTGRGDRDVAVHLLGYQFDPEHPAIMAEQARLRAERVERLHRMTEKMAADGYPVDPEMVFALIPDGASVGRPHLARALVAAGVVGSVTEAIATLRDSSLAREAFGDDVVAHYLNMAEVEQRAYDMAVTDWERRRYFERG